MDDRTVMSETQDKTPSLDLAVLESLFAMGDGSLRIALGSQLQADFERLHEALGVEDGYLVGRAAHELKGLAATVGAERLAGLARAIDPIAAGMAPAALAVVIKPLRAEIDAVLAVLRDVTGPVSD